MSDGEVRVKLREMARKEAEELKNEVDKINRQLMNIRIKYGVPESAMESIISLVQDLQKKNHLYRLAKFQVMMSVHPGRG